MPLLLTDGRFRATDSDGDPLVNGRLYTYVSGTTTFQAVYNSAALTTPCTYVSDGLGGQYIALDARGETQAWLGAGLTYTFLLKSSTGVSVWSLDGLSDGSQGLTTFTTNLAASGGSSLVGYLPSGVGAVPRTVQSGLRDQMTVADFGGTFDGSTDDSGIIQAAVTAIAVAGGGTLKFPYGKSIKIANTVKFSTGVWIDLNHCTIIGPGTGAGAPIFETGYLSGGAIVTNIGTFPGTHRVLDCHIFNGKIQNCNKAFNLLNFDEGSSLHDIQFSNCTYGCYTDNPYYSSYERLTSRGAAGGVITAAFAFINFVNAITLSRCTVVDRVLGYSFGGGTYGLNINTCTAETCNSGFQFLGIVNSVKATGNYFEHITSTCWVFSEPSGTQFFGIDIDNNWYNDVNNCIVAVNWRGRWGRANFRNSGNCNVDFSVSTNSAVVELDRNYTTTNITTPGLPAGFSLGNRCIGIGDDTICDSGSGDPLIRSFNYGESRMPRRLYGDPGEPGPGVIPFCTHAHNAASTPFSVIVDTNITYRTYGTTNFHISVTDDIDQYIVYGRVYGATVVQDDATAKVVTASNNGGLLRLSISQFDNPTGDYVATGVVEIA